MDHLLGFLHSEHGGILDVDIQMLQAWLVFAPPSNFYTASTVLSHKYGGDNVAVKTFLSHFSMFVPTKTTVKLSNGNTGHAQVIGVILYRFPKYSIIYPVVPVYYFPGHPSNTISSSALKVYVGFKKFTSCWNNFVQLPYLWFILTHTSCYLPHCVLYNITTNT